MQIPNLDIVTVLNNALIAFGRVRSHIEYAGKGASYLHGNRRTPENRHPVTEISNTMHIVLGSACALTSSLLNLERSNMAVAVAAAAYDAQIEHYAGLLQDIARRVKEADSDFAYTEAKHILQHATPNEIKLYVEAYTHAQHYYARLEKACARESHLSVGDPEVLLPNRGNRLFHLLLLGKGARHMRDDTRIPMIIGEKMVDTLGAGSVIWPKLLKKVIRPLQGHPGGERVLQQLAGQLERPFEILRMKISENLGYYQNLQPQRREANALSDLTNALEVPGVPYKSPQPTQIGRWADYIASRQQPVDGLPAGRTS